MAQLRPTEMMYGRASDPADFVETAAAPVYRSTVSPYDIPPMPAYDPLIPYIRGPQALPPYAEHPPLYEPLPPPPHEIPEDMVIPGVQHPDGRFEPHPYYARRGAHAPEKEEKEEKEEAPHKVELAVPLCCEECEEEIVTYLEDTPGVEAVQTDVDHHKVTVVGDIAPEYALQRCKKCFKKSSIISST